jgi:fatty-acyl-CoA synthase
VFPSEIEEFLKTHDNISAANVFCLNMDGFDKYICAWVILKDSSKPTTAQEIKSFCLESLNAKRAPHFIKIVDDFPVGSGGKTLKTEMARLFKLELGF